MSVHQHYGYRVHVDLTKGTFGSRSFERRFPSYESCELFSVTLIESYPEGLCACFLVREGLAIFGGWDYGGRYDLQCMGLAMCALALMYVPPQVRGFHPTPRQIKEWDEMRREGPVPRRYTS